MQRKWLRICALLCVAICLGQAEAGKLGLVGRQDTPTEDAGATITPAPTSGGGEEQQTSATRESSRTAEPSSTSFRPSTTGEAISSTGSLVPTTAPSAINGNNPDNSTDTTVVVAPGELPLEPQLTPGWGVAGAIMLITGATFTLIGIKNGWLLTFFSSAFLTSLCTAILIVYVMAPPITDAIQGAYVVAVVVTGLILGGAATLFRELTEGFGCLLGGFCVSMWLLTLKEGGLLTGTTEKIIFICAFTLGGYAFYFSHYTRGYALIGLTSFSGATVTVLGIDCFTRAGLKEYWAYIWNLNKNLFPLATDTYPLTKVIRVEIALIIIFTVLGVISQLKLWMVIQERRAKRAEELAEEQRQRDLEEANVGQQVEEENKRERQQWEATYGDQQPLPGTSIGSRDSGVSDVDNEKKARFSESTTTAVPVPAPANGEVEIEIEMQDLPPRQNADGLVVSDQHEDDGRVTVRVASDEAPTRNEPEETVWIAGADGEVRPASAASSRKSQRLSGSMGPEVMPLPFRIPHFEEELAERDAADRSSFATMADEDERSIVLNKRLSRMSVGNRLSMLSVGSGKLIRTLSGRSQRSQTSRRKSGGFGSRPQSPAPRESSEELVVERRVASNADTASIAATVDGMSEDDSDKSGGVEVGEPGRFIEITAKLADRAAEADSGTKEKKAIENTGLKPKATYHGLRPYSMAETVGTDILDPAVMDEPAGAKSKRNTAKHTQVKTDTINTEAGEPTKEQAETPKNPQSAAASVSSSRASLTKDRLPSGLSRVALSYRTNEWAKHLSQAETPQPEMLQLNEYPEQEVTAEKREPAVPVNVEELRQTAESSVPVLPIFRASSSASKTTPQLQVPEPVYRSSSRATVNSKTASPLTQPSPGQNANGGAPVSPVSPLPPTGPQASRSFRMKPSSTNRRTSTDVSTLPIAEERVDERLSTGAQLEGRKSFTPNVQAPSPPPEQYAQARSPVPGVIPYASPQTLLGQRELLLRNKSQPLLAASPIPEYPEHRSGPSSEAGSLYNYRSSSLPMPAPPDIDDIPLSQRKELMRNNSVLSMASAAGGNRSSSSAMAMQHIPRSTPTPLPQVNTDALVFNSHQPRRRSTAPSPAQRESQLANFRSSVAADLRAGTLPASNNNNNGSNHPYHHSGRETPFFAGSAGNPIQSISGGGVSLGGSSGAVITSSKERDGEVRRSIDRSRTALLSQKEQEAQRRELERWEKERSERAFEEMMRSGTLVDAHREAMRKLQGGVRDA